MGTDIWLRVFAERGERQVEITRDVLGADPAAHDATSRSYVTFAFLADVRNGRGVAAGGFGGVRSRYDRITPQFAGRGAPSWVDVDDGRDDEDGLWLGEHSHTFATLAELRAAPWDLVVHDHGLVDVEDYLRWRDSGKVGAPASWCEGSSGRKLTEAELHELETRGQIPTGFVHVIASWDWQPLLACHFKKWIDSIDASRFGTDDDGITVVMGFDS